MRACRKRDFGRADVRNFQRFPINPDTHGRRLGDDPLAAAAMRQELPLFVAGRIVAKIWIEIGDSHAREIARQASTCQEAP